MDVILTYYDVAIAILIIIPAANYRKNIFEYKI